MRTQHVKCLLNNTPKASCCFILPKDECGTVEIEYCFSLLVGMLDSQSKIGPEKFNSDI